MILSDGSKWTIISDKQDQKDQIIDTISKLWKKDDDIRIDVLGDKSELLVGKPGPLNDRSGLFAMKNVREKSAFLVKSSEKCADLSKAFFITHLDPSGYLMKVADIKSFAENDAAKIKTFVIGYFGACTSRNWEEGYRVVINQSIYSENDYSIINPNNGSTVWVTQVLINS